MSALPKFVIQDLESHENRTIYFYGLMNNISSRFNKLPLQEGEIPVGTVDFVEELYGKVIPPNYFPAFLDHYISRHIFNWNGPVTPKERCFIKPADKHKRFDGQIVGPDWVQFSFPWICSEIVCFVDEWRYYIVNGKILDACWYKGVNEDSPAPKVQVEWPNNWCGAVDFGMLDSGRLELIESHPPYACGWYGKDRNVYGQFITEGWKFITKI